MSDRDESSLAAATAPAAARCCPYLLRIVAGTANVLNKPLDQRRSHQCLSSMVEWLFSECASVEAQFRRQCMHLFTTLCPCCLISRGLLIGFVRTFEITAYHRCSWFLKVPLFPHQHFLGNEPPSAVYFGCIYLA